MWWFVCAKLFCDIICVTAIYVFYFDQGGDADPDDDDFDPLAEVRGGKGKRGRSPGKGGGRSPRKGRCCKVLQLVVGYNPFSCIALNSLQG